MKLQGMCCSSCRKFWPIFHPNEKLNEGSAVRSRFPRLSEFCRFLNAERYTEGQATMIRSWQSLSKNLHIPAKSSNYVQNNRLAIVICPEVVIVHKPSFYINLNCLCGRYEQRANICFQFLQYSKKSYLKKCVLIFSLLLTLLPSNHTPPSCLTVTNDILADSYFKQVWKRSALSTDRIIGKRPTVFNSAYVSSVEKRSLLLI